MTQGALIHPVRRVAAAQHRGETRGLPCVCSAQTQVLEAALIHAGDTGLAVCIESTSNQVNPWGGYTGMTPDVFASRVRNMAQRLETPGALIVLGGDHLGPHPWRGEPAGQAMQKARRLVQDCVRAGYTKLHLDASMPCVDDPRDVGGGLPAALSADRSADLCRVAEAAAVETNAPVYVVGTEVPRPGGAQADEATITPTRPEDARQTLETMRAAFRSHDLEHAWERVAALVVQPGVEFGDEEIHNYNPRRARPLAQFIMSVPGMVYEAHSTDYQPSRALRALVRDHFALLKVGPWLTYAFREAVFALAAIEQECRHLPGWGAPSRLRETLDETMLTAPADWQPYTRGTPGEQALSRRFGLSDRSRYYWTRPPVAAALKRLLDNLTAQAIPHSLLSQYLPRQYAAVTTGPLRPKPLDLIRHHIAHVLTCYTRACRAGKTRAESPRAPLKRARG